MADPVKTMGDTLAQLMKAAEPAFKQAAQQVDEAARVGRERFKEQSEKLDREWDEFDAELDRRWHGRR